MDDRYWDAAARVGDFEAASGCAESTVATHARVMRELAAWLDGAGDDCTGEAVGEWLAECERTMSHQSLKVRRVVARRLLNALDGAEIEDPSLMAGVGPSDWSRLAGWSRDAVASFADEYGSAHAAGGRDVARRCAARFLVASGLEDASPADVTADAIVGYVASCGGARDTRGQRLSMLRGFLRHLASRGEAPAWAHLLASDAYARESAWRASADWPDASGAEPESLLGLAEGLVGRMRSEGYSKSVTAVTSKAAGMLCIALSLGGAPYTPANARAWLDAASGCLGTRLGSFDRALRELEWQAGHGSSHAPDSRAGRDPLAGMPEWSRAEAGAYLALRRREGWAESTAGCAARAIRRLASHADARGVGSWRDLDAQTLSDWCLGDAHATPAGRATYVSRARGFLEYLCDAGVVGPGVCLAARSSSAPRRAPAKVLDDGQVAALVAARASASTPIELRDAAMVALGLTMGLRAGDVVALRLDAIDWRRGTVTVVQRKTLVGVELPLTVAAGNAILAWLERGRPAGTGSPLVFLGLRAPRGSGLGRQVCNAAMRRALGEGCPSFHATRRTFATNMLRAGGDVAGVSEALGHRGARSVEPYLSLDGERMRMCALSPEDAGIGAAR